MNFFPIIIGLSLGASILIVVKSSKKKVLTKDGKGIAKYLMSKGYSKSNSAGIAGNIYTESKYNPTALGDNGTSFGLAQWHKTRWNGLIEYSKKNNLNHKTFEAQLDYLDWELKNTEKKAFKKLTETNKPYDSAFVFAKYFERPAVIVNERMQKAEEIYNQI